MNAGVAAPPGGGGNVPSELHAGGSCVSFIPSANFHLRLIESIQINRIPRNERDCRNFIPLASDRPMSESAGFRGSAPLRT